MSTNVTIGAEQLIKEVKLRLIRFQQSPQTSLAIEIASNYSYKDEYSVNRSKIEELIDLVDSDVLNAIDSEFVLELLNKSLTLLNS